jgi:hypothetical protein
MIDRPPKPEGRPSSPRFRDRKKEGAKPNKRELPDDLNPIMAELMKQSDRGAAIIAGSVLEQILEAAIKARLRPLLGGQQKALFGRMAPLSTFSAKIELGFVIGLYSEAAYTNLNMIREVRNKFAHEFDALSFDHPLVAKIILNPDRPRLLKSTAAEKPKGQFMGAFGVLGSLLLAMKFQNIQLPSVAETHGEVLREMGRALKVALAQKRSNHPPGSRGAKDEPAS